jgi:hypothetical protein
METARSKSEHEGKTIVPVAQKLQLTLLRRIEAEADTVDAAGAAELLRPVNRILENADRVRMNEKSQYSDLPVIHMHISAGMVMTTTAVGHEPVTAIVEDVLPKEAPGAQRAQATEPPAADVPAGLDFDVEPLPLDGSAS